MSAEQGFIEYVFETRGAEGLVNAISDIESKVEAGEASFSELESAIRTVTSLAPSLGSSIEAAIKKASPAGLQAQWGALAQEMREVQSAYQDFQKAQALGIPTGQTPAGIGQIDQYIQAHKAANSDIVRDSIRAYQETGQAQVNIARQSSARQHQIRVQEVGQERALEERLATERARLRRATSQMDAANQQKGAEGLKQQAAAAQLVSQRYSDVSRTVKELEAVRARAAAKAEQDANRERQAVERLTQQRDKAQKDAAGAEQMRARRETANETDRQAEAQQRLNKALQEEQAARGRLAAAQGQSGSAGLKAQAQAYRDIGAAVREGEQATRELAGAQEGIIQQRYALYDLATTYAAVGTAMAGAGLYATVIGAQYQSAFTNVERTLDPIAATPEIVDSIRQSLVQLQGQIPLTFAELSEIATIGNQMDIAEEDIIDFTETIARFSSVSGMSIEEVSKAFGGFMAQTGLAPKYLENLGSSLAMVSIKSNATEAEILSISKEIAALSTNAGLSADQIVGLAGTFASLRIQPERARGSLGTYFGTLRKAVAGGGQDLENFATVVGVTSDELDRMVRSGEGAAVLEGFLSRLNETDAVGVTQALDELGLAQLRVEDTFIRLSNGLGIFQNQMQIAKSSFIEGAELNRQYSMTVDDLASQWTILINGLNAVVEAISGGAVPGLAGLLTMVNRLIYAFQEWLQRNSWARYLILFGGALVTIIGVMTLFRAITLRANASLLAYRVAVVNAGAAGIAATGGIRGLAAALFGVGQGATAGARGLRIFRAALVSTGIGALAVGAGFLAEKLMGTKNGADKASLSMKEYDSIAKAAADTTKGAGDDAGGLADALGGGGGGGGGGGKKKSVAKAAEEAAEKVRTLVDYVGDLSGVMNRSYELRFGSGSAMDDIVSKWNKLNEEMSKYRAEVRSLTADRKLKKYWLSIAEMYDDQLRAGVLREDIAEIDDKLAVANAGASTALRGNSQAAIDNRSQMLELVKANQAYIESLARSGASQQFIQQEVRRLNGEFMAQATQLGFSREEVKKYALSFQDISKIIDSVPREITVGFNADPATQAINEFLAKTKEDAKVAGEDAGEALGGGIGDGLGGGGGIPMDGFEDDLGDLEDLFGEGGEDAADNWGANFLQFLQEAWANIRSWFMQAGAEIGAIFDTIYNGWDPLKGFWATVEENEHRMRNEMGALGWAGAEAMNAEFEASENIGEVILDGIAYAKDPVTGELSRVGAMSAEEYNASLGEGILPGAVIVDGINYAEDPITGEIYRVGQESAGSWNEALGVHTDPKILANKVKEGKGLSNAEARIVAESMGLNYNSVMNSTADPIGRILNKIRDGKPLSQEEARELGAANALSYNARFGGRLTIGDKIAAAFRTTGSNGAWSAGQRSGNLWVDAFKLSSQGLGSWISNMIKGGSDDGKSRSKGRRSGGGMATGGYTGRGHWLTPAPYTVHRGEYVIPKKGVDQRTGLPDLNYVQSLQRGKTPPKTSYATGGMVNGGGAMMGPLDLSARTIQQLAAVVKSEIYMDGRLVGDAAARSYAQQNRVGAS